MRKINRIVIHCSATEEGKSVSVDEIRRWHKARGFQDIGYHYVINIDGGVHFGRPIEQAGAHAQGYNANSIGICYVGGLSLKILKPMDTRTDDQRKTLSILIARLQEKYPIAYINGHRDLSVDLNGDGVITPGEWMKSCPCFNVHDEYKV